MDYAGVAGSLTTRVTRSLADVLDDSKAPAHVDLLSLDTEGSELDILRGFPFRRRTFGALIIEHNYVSEKRNAIRDLLERQGYVRALCVSHDDVYVQLGLLAHNQIRADPRGCGSFQVLVPNFPYHNHGASDAFLHDCVHDRGGRRRKSVWNGIEEQIDKNRILMGNDVGSFDASQRLPICSLVMRSCLQSAKDYGLLSGMVRDHDARKIVNTREPPRQQLQTPNATNTSLPCLVLLEQDYDHTPMLVLNLGMSSGRVLEHTLRTPYWKQNATSTSVSSSARILDDPMDEICIANGLNEQECGDARRQIDDTQLAEHVDTYLLQSTKHATQRVLDAMMGWAAVEKSQTRGAQGERHAT